MLNRISKDQVSPNQSALETQYHDTRHQLQLAGQVKQTSDQQSFQNNKQLEQLQLKISDLESAVKLAKSNKYPKLFDLQQTS